MLSYNMQDAINLADAYETCKNILPGNYKCHIRNAELLNKAIGNTMRFTLEYQTSIGIPKFVFADYPLYGHGKSFFINSMMPIFVSNNCELNILYINTISDNELLDICRLLIGVTAFFKVERKGNYNNIRLYQDYTIIK